MIPAEKQNRIRKKVSVSFLCARPCVPLRFHQTTCSNRLFHTEQCARALQPDAPSAARKHWRSASAAEVRGKTSSNPATDGRPYRIACQKRSLDARVAKATCVQESRVWPNARAIRCRRAWGRSRGQPQSGEPVLQSDPKIDPPIPNRHGSSKRCAPNHGTTLLAKPEMPPVKRTYALAIAKAAFLRASALSVFSAPKPQREAFPLGA